MFNFSIEQTQKPKIDTTDTYDFIALGAGPAALNAALYAARKGLSTLIIGYEIGGQLKNTADVDNYLGFGFIEAEKLIESFVSHVKKHDIEMLTGLYIHKIEKLDDLFYITLSNGDVVKALSVLYALGGSPRQLGIPNETTFASKGVSYCVTCDGPFFKGKHVVVAGGGNSAVDAAIDLARIANKVTIIHRSQFRADKKSLDKLEKLDNVSYMLETQILGLDGDAKLEKLRLLDKKTNTESILEADGLFIEIGSIPNSQLLEGLVELSPYKEVIVDENQKTSLRGLYAAGDVTINPHKQIIIAAAEGAKAALEAAIYINNKGE